MAYSGGRDSTALLHATCLVAAYEGWQVHALHVHHGLSQQADAWEAHCHQACERWQGQGLPVQLQVEHVHVRGQARLGTEAAARDARYAALARMAHAAGCDAVLLAHHQNDQAETVLLQALRSGSVHGLAAMPAAVRRAGLTWFRPWLMRPRTQIDAYVRAHGLAYVDDDSNGDPRLARNRLRLQVWPALAAAFPQAARALTTVAAQSQDAAAVLDEVARADLIEALNGAGLRQAVLRTWSPARRRNALRKWLLEGGQGVTRHALVRLADEAAFASTGTWELASATVRVHRGHLVWEPRRECPDQQPLQPPASVHLPAQVGRHPVPAWCGTLEVTAVGEGGVPLPLLGALWLRGREGSDRFQAGPSGVPRPLKKAFQTAGVPAWSRGGPVVCDAQGHLVFVPGLGLDARWVMRAGATRVTLRWVPDSTASPR